jgi:hypothetical protein
VSSPRSRSEITEPLPVDGDPHTVQDHEQSAFYRLVVDVVRAGESKDVPAGTRVPRAAELTPGPVRQPNHLRCVRSGTWKLALKDMYFALKVDGQPSSAQKSQAAKSTFRQE